MKKIKIISISLLSGLILLSTNSLAIKGIVNAPSGLVLREKASKTSNPITTVEDKAVVEILQESGEWYKVKYNNNEGYLFAEFVNAQKEEKIEEPEETAKEQEKPENNANENEDSNKKQDLQKRKVKSDLKIYLIPSLTANTIETVKKGAEVTINYELNNWANITYGNNTGWIRKYFIMEETKTTNTVQNEQPVTSENDSTNEEKNNNEQNDNTTNQNIANETTNSTILKNGKGYINVSVSANIREQASTSSAIKDTLLKNTEVQIVGEEGDFYKIQYNDITGYIAKSLITEKPIAE